MLGFVCSEHLARSPACSTRSRRRRVRFRGEVVAEQRSRVATALDELADHLLEHFEFEEENVAETMRSMSSI
jgi:hypothetical protein